MSSNSASIHRQIYQRVRQSIADGRVGPGDRLAPTRILASQLGVARGTVDLAYGQLAAEGYIITRGAKGTFVSSILVPPGPSLNVAGEAAHDWPRRSPSAAFRTEFCVGLPALDLFPRKLWATLSGRHARSLTQENLSYPPAAGDERLRAALANYLQIARGIRCSLDQIIITGGYQSALSLIGRVLLNPGDQVLVEDPGYGRTAAALERLGVELRPVAVDSQGMKIDEGVAASLARLCVVTPANQFPLGVALSLPRRFALLDWAVRTSGWIVEDDYDGEFYYNSRPLPALKSLDDREDRVFYVGTFSKTLYPGLRLGYVVVPERQAQRFAAACYDLDGGRSGADQAVVTDFIVNGYFASHLKRMRAAYKSRREVATQALNAELGHAMQFGLLSSGLHAIGWLKNGYDDGVLLKRALGAGVPAHGDIEA